MLLILDIIGRTYNVFTVTNGFSPIRLPYCNRYAILVWVVDILPLYDLEVSFKHDKVTAEIGHLLGCRRINETRVCKGIMNKCPETYNMFCSHIHQEKLCRWEESKATSHREKVKHNIDKRW